ncbi:MAG TPA: hypothetical protein VHD83_12160 [Puia sp.]|nr:hypothetical protein [Puia sp.]
MRWMKQSAEMAAAVLSVVEGGLSLVKAGGIEADISILSSVVGNLHHPPSSADEEALKSLGQSKQYVLHGGEITTVRPKK